MKQDASLNFDFIPYWTIPFRFFLTAPLFSMVAGLLLFIFGVQNLAGIWFEGSDTALWQSRWLTEVIVTLHLITLGTITMIMVGALFQVTSVVGGRLLPGGKTVAAIVYSFLVLGAVLFFLAMTTRITWLFVLATFFLVTALLMLSVCGLIAIFRAQRNSPTLSSMALSIVSLLVMICAGGLLLMMHGYSEYIGFDRRWTDFHLVWALAGWVGLLIMGVSFQVIPMFHVTPSFNPLLQKILPIAVFISIILTSLSNFFFTGEILALVCQFTLLACYGVYGIAVWRLLNKRKRKIEDITVQFWKVAVISFFVFFIMHVVSGAGIKASWGNEISLMSGIVLIFGVALSVIGGMLQKIIPFLSYLHMQRFCQGDFERIKTLPHMRAILKVKHSRLFLRLHLLSFALLLLMVVIPELTLFAGLALFVEFALLFFITVQVVRMVWKTEQSLSVDY